MTIRKCGDAPVGVKKIALTSQGKRIVLPGVITLKAGRYSRLGGSWNNPVHDVVLPRDFRLMMLTIGFLKQFAKRDSFIRKILFHPGNSMGGDMSSLYRDVNPVYAISVLDIQKLLKVINPILAGIKLRIPVEALLDVYLGAPEYAVGRFRQNLWVPAVNSGSRETYLRVEVDKFDIEAVFAESIQSPGTLSSEGQIIPEAQEYEEALSVLRGNAPSGITYRTFDDPVERFLQSSHIRPSYNGAVLEVVSLK